MKVEEIIEQAEGYQRAIRAAKSVAAKESALSKLLGLADQFAFVRVPGVGGPRLAAKKAHLAETVRALEVAEAKLTTGSPALGQRIRDLKSERDFLTRSVRSEEDRILSVLQGSEE